MKDWRWKIKYNCIHFREDLSGNYTIGITKDPTDRYVTKCIPNPIGFYYYDSSIEPPIEELRNCMINTLQTQIDFMQKKIEAIKAAK